MDVAVEWTFCKKNLILGTVHTLSFEEFAYFLKSISYILADDLRDQEGGRRARDQREERVDHRALLRVVRVRDGGVEARPEHPEEDGADHGEEVRVVDGAVVLAVVPALAVDGPRRGQPEVGAERVHDDRAAQVVHLKRRSSESHEGIRVVFGASATSV